MTTATEIDRIVEVPEIQGRALLLSLATDLDEAGQPAEQWLTVTEREVAVVLRERDPVRCLRSFPLEHIEGCRVQSEVGSGYLQVKQGAVWIDLVRFSNRLAPTFREAADKLERLRRHREFVIDEHSAAPRTCSQCGAKLSGPGSVCQRCLPPVQVLRRVCGLLRPYARTVLIIGVLSIVTVVIELVPPWLQKVLVDDILVKRGGTNSLLASLAMIVGCLATVRVVAAGLAVWKARLSSEIGTHLTADLRSQMVEKLQRLSVSYHDRNQVGALMSRVSYDTEAMHTFMHQVSGGYLLQLLQMLAIGAMLFWLNPKLALYALLPTPIVLVASWFFYRSLYSQHHRYWDAIGRQAAALTSVLSGIRVVKSFTQEPREAAKFTETSHRLRDSRVKVDVTNATFSSLIGVLFGLGGLIVWYVGGRDVFGNQMSLGSLMAFLAYLSMFYAPLTTISEGASWISSFLAASHRIFELLDTPVSTDEPAAPQTVEPMRGHIQFEQVSFSYDDQQPALREISFEVQPGESVGIVGRSGSGKSTLVCLVSRLYEATTGRVTIDGIDVRQMSSTQLRRHVGMVLQEPFLFEGTVAQNIAYGDPGATPERILASAKAACAHDFITRMPFGYETPLGERGAGLSGGERQRVSIARAVLYDPQILILDEATSSIDTESERLIQYALERFSRGRTTLAIAHRLSTLERSDRLLVLDQGRLIEQGTHSELLARQGRYAQLVRMQFGGLASEDEHSPEAETILNLLKTRATAEERNGHEAAPVSAESNGDRRPIEWEICWFEPQQANFIAGPHGVLTLQHRGQELQGIYTVRAFPATYSEEFLSVRYTDADGHDSECGMLRRLGEWPDAVQELLRRSLNRRYLFRVLTSFTSFSKDNGFVSCRADSDNGPVEFVVHHNPHCVKRFGYNGRLLTDLDDNHYLIPDIDELSFLQRRLFRLHFQEL